MPDLNNTVISPSEGSNGGTGEITVLLRSGISLLFI